MLYPHCCSVSTLLPGVYSDLRCVQTLLRCVRLFMLYPDCCSVSTLLLRLFPSVPGLCCGVSTLFHALSRLLWCIRFASRCVQTVVRCVRPVSWGSHLLLVRDQRSYRAQRFQRRRDRSRSQPQVLRLITKDRAGPSVYSFQFFSAFVRFCLDFVLFFRSCTVFCFVFKMRLYKCFVVNVWACFLSLTRIPPTNLWK